MANGGGHPPDLAFTSLLDGDFEPGRGYCFAVTNRLGAGKGFRFNRQQLYLGRAGSLTLDQDALPELLQGGFIWNILDLDQVGFG